MTPEARAAVIERDEPIAVSAVIAWEYADLRRRGRLATAVPFDALLAGYDLDVVPLPAAVWRLAATLPDVHRDPIDRMLIAHAIAEGRAIVTADAMIRRYPVRCIG